MRIATIIFLLLIVHLGASQEENHDAHQSSTERERSTKIRQEATCGLWLAESAAVKNSLGLFAGVDIPKGEDVSKTGGELHIPIYDKNPREWSKLHDVWWTQGITLDFALQSHYHSYSFLPGVGATTTCQDGKANIQLFPTEEVESLGVHRHKDETAGSFTYRLHSEYVASETIEAGQELLLDCREQKRQENNRKEQESKTFDLSNALCVDTLDIKPSTIPGGVGRGAFSKRNVKKGETVAVSPVIAFDESETYMTEQDVEEEGGYHNFYDQIVGYQLLYNYCYGHKNSSVFLLPTGPGVNAINHKSEEANVELRWSNSTLNGNKDFLNMYYPSLFERRNLTMILEYVALKDIEEGDEIFLNYGRSWEKHFDYFIENDWESPPFSSKYISATDYRKEHIDEPFRTVEEQLNQRYPRNIITSCFFQETEESLNQDPVTWSKANNGCLRPCRILERQSADNGDYLYKAEVQEMPTEIDDGTDDCELAKTHKIVESIPSKAIVLTDRAYTTDEHMVNTFRSFINVPNGLYPNSWMRDDPKDMGDFLHPKLKAGQIEPIRWESTGEVVTDNAYMIKMQKSVRKDLLDYCVEMGIASYFRQLTYRGNSLKAGGQETAQLGGIKWHVRRPPPHWKSDMHWMSPLDEDGHLDYLQELKMAGFDDVLKSISDYFDMGELAVYTVAFMGVSYSSGGFIHQDISGSGGKVFKLIIPLILADETGPELDISANNEAGPVGRLRYRNNVGIMLGDDALHGSSGTDYRSFREMRLLAVIYVGDADEENIDEIVRLPQYNPPHDEL